MSRISDRHILIIMDKGRLTKLQMSKKVQKAAVAT